MQPIASVNGCAVVNVPIVNISVIVRETECTSEKETENCYSAT